MGELIMQLTEIVWDENWELGIKYIDDQHKHLISLVNCISKCQILDSYEFLSDLIQYSSNHFNDEEDLMSSIDFPEIDDHKKEHRMFTRAMLEYSFRLNNGEDKVILRDEMCEFVSKWFAYHFLQTDRNLVNFVKEEHTIEQIKKQFEK